MPIPLRLRIALLGLVASHACCTWLGWELRDRSADLAAIRVQATQETGRADTAIAARQQDQTNAQAGAQAESQHLALQSVRTQQFTTLQQDIDTHAKDPGRDRGDADAEFVRIWREANAGHPLRP
ncbi:MAG: hypothetical protein ACN6PQ_01740 [Stenotrophomonas indicatrix]|uniref:hypothetical protein n=1 Tax=Stenotrophomonas indicatrix TaxID=2045451 RepID=UPI003D128C0B